MVGRKSIVKSIVLKQKSYGVIEFMIQANKNYGIIDLIINNAPKMPVPEKFKKKPSMYLNAKALYDTEVDFRKELRNSFLNKFWGQQLNSPLTQERIFNFLQNKVNERNGKI